MESIFPPLNAKKIQNIIRAGRHLQIAKSSSIDEEIKLQIIAKKKIERYFKEKEYSYKDFISPEK